MRKFLKVAVPLLLAVVIVLSISWYFFQYDSTFTRNLLLQQARRLEEDGKHDMAVWLYNLAYEHYGDDDAVAIELAQQFKDIGNYTKAEYTLSKAIEDGGSIELYIALCQTYLEQDKLRDAVLMLDSVTDPAIKAQLDQLRPAAPQASAASGTYMQYINVEFTADGTLYVNKNEDYPSMHSDRYTAPITLPAGQTTLFAVCVGENGLVSPLAVYHYVVGSVVEEVTFADPVIEQAVRTLLGVNESYVIHSNQLWDVTSFTIPAGACDCSDLKWMPYLEELIIESGDFQSLAPLGSLTRLNTLTVTGCTLSLSDLQVIAGLPLLQDLALRECGISNITPLSACTGLKSLDLTGNAIRDLSPLSQLTQLRTLCLRSNAVIHASDLTGLVNLQSLDLSYNSLTTTSPLSVLTSLVSLDVSANGLMKLENLNTLVNLQEFTATNNNLIDVNALADCSQLIKLNVAYNTLLNIDVAATLTNLEELNFSHNEVSTLPKFASTCALRIIDGSYNSLSSVERLSGLVNLTHVYMDYNTSLSTADSLAKCPTLMEVHLYGTKVRSVKKLTELGIFVQYTPT